MSSTTSWTTLFFLLLSPLAATLPLPLPLPSADSTRNSPNLAPRSPKPVPDPRMIPGRTDLISEILARLDMEELNKFNKLHPEEYENQSDDKNSHTITVTTHYDDVEAGKGASTVEGQHNADGQDRGHDRNGQDDANANANDGESGKTGKGDKDKEGGKEGAEKQGKDAAEDSQGFVDTLFEVLRKKLRKTLNGSDELSLR